MVPQIEIVVISLKNSTDRRRMISEQMNDIDVEWRFFDGIVVDSYPDCYDFNYRNKWFGFDMTPGEVGCFLSHRELWEECSSGKKLYCILEDDIILGRNFLDALVFADRYKKNFDMLRLMQLQKRRSFKTFSADGFSTLMFHEQPTGAQGYFINPNAAAILAGHTKTITEPVDNIMDQYWKTKLNIFCIDPPVISVADFPSCIGDRGWDRRPLWCGLKRDIRTGLSNVYRMVYNFNRYRKFA